MLTPRPFEALISALLFIACGSESPPTKSGAAAGAGAGDGAAGSVASGGSTSPTPSAGASTGGGSNGGGGNDAGGSNDAGSDQGGAGEPSSAGAGGEASGPRCGVSWPQPGEDVEVGEPLTIADSFDGMLQRYVGPDGSGGQDESQDPLFILEDGATLENVVIGSPAADGIHCLGSCTLRNVWWEDVGEDAATLKGEDPNQRMLVECGGARLAEDKVFQHNGPGTMVIRHFEADGFGKLYRSCGNCSEMYERHVELDGVVAQSGDVLAGINVNYGDTARFSDVTVHGSENDVAVCQRYEGNDDGDEPVLLGSGPDGEHCLFSSADVTFTE